MYVCQHLSFISNGKATEGKSRSKPDPGNLAVRDCRGACRNMLHGLITICHEVGNDGYRGSYRPKTGVRHIPISTRMRFPIADVDFDAVMTVNSQLTATKRQIKFPIERLVNLDMLPFLNPD